MRLLESRGCGRRASFPRQSAPCGVLGLPRSRASTSSGDGSRTTCSRSAVRHRGVRRPFRLLRRDRRILPRSAGPEPSRSGLHGQGRRRHRTRLDRGRRQRGGWPLRPRRNRVRRRNGRGRDAGAGAGVSIVGIVAVTRTASRSSLSRGIGRWNAPAGRSSDGGVCVDTGVIDSDGRQRLKGTGCRMTDGAAAVAEGASIEEVISAPPAKRRDRRSTGMRHGRRSGRGRGASAGFGGSTIGAAAAGAARPPAPPRTRHGPALPPGCGATSGAAAGAGRRSPSSEGSGCAGPSGRARSSVESSTAGASLRPPRGDESPGSIRPVADTAVRGDVGGATTGASTTGAASTAGSTTGLIVLSATASGSRSRSRRAGDGARQRAGAASDRTRRGCAARRLRAQAAAVRKIRFGLKRRLGAAWTGTGRDAQDARLDDEVVLSPDEKKMLDLVAPDENQLALGIDHRDVHHRQPRAAALDLRTACRRPSPSWRSKER